MSGTYTTPDIGHHVEFFFVDYAGFELTCECGEVFKAETRWRTLAMYGVHYQTFDEESRDVHGHYVAATSKAGGSETDRGNGDQEPFEASVTSPPTAPDHPVSWPVTTPHEPDPEAHP